MKISYHFSFLILIIGNTKLLIIYNDKIILSFSNLFIYFIYLAFSYLNATSFLTPTDAKSLLNLAKEYQFGINRHIDIDKSIKYYNKVIDGNIKGNYLSTAYFGLAEIYEENHHDFEKSYEYIILAAEAGHPTAQHRLATSYITGIFSNLSPINISLSLLLEKASSLANDPEANMGLGYRYLYGIGVEKSCRKALKYYEFSANEAAKQIERRGYPIFYDTMKISELENIRKESEDEVSR